MTDEEKILRFAGYTYWNDNDEGNPSRSGKVGWYDPGGEPVSSLGIYNPDGGTKQQWLLPDTTDLTWLFKWCVPKLDNYELNKGGTYGHRAYVSLELAHGNEDARTAGEALRGAILALIGEDKGG